MRAMLVLLAIPLLVPLADASWFSTTIHVPEYAFGDTARIRYWGTTTDAGANRTYENVGTTRIDGLGTALDGDGVPRDTLELRIDSAVPGQPTYSALCHQLAGGAEAVRTDVLAGNSRWESHWDGSGGITILGRPILGGGSMSLNTTYTTSLGGFCNGILQVPAKRYSEGDRVSIHDFAFLDDPDFATPALSAPARAADFHGRDALRFSWNARDVLPADEAATHPGDITVTLADGLPGVVAIDETWSTPGGQSGEGHAMLDAFVAGPGLAVPAYSHARLPAAAPGVSFASPDPFALDDAAFHLPFPYADAIVWLKLDPRTGFAAWTQQHPTAKLAYAYYDRSGNANAGAAEDAEGSWFIALADGPTSDAWWVARSVPHGTGSLIPSAAHDTSGYELGEQKWMSKLAVGSGHVADSASVLRAVRASQVKLDAIEGVGLSMLYGGAWTVGDVSGSAETTSGTRTGHQLFVDARSGHLGGIAQTQKTTSAVELVPLAPGLSGLGAPRASASAALIGPASGAGLAGSAALGVGLLLLLLKFVLIPLFTRLRKDKLLDNPVRARLYERIRAEPGIHLAELIDYAGIGEGATRHHVDQLANHRYVAVLRDQGFVRYYAAGEVPASVARRESILRAGSMRAVYDLYATHPNSTLRDAARRLGISAPSVHRAKKRLEKEGLLPAGRDVEVTATA